MLDERPTDDVDDSIGEPSVLFTRPKTKFRFNFLYNGDGSYLYLNKTQISKI